MPTSSEWVEPAKFIEWRGVSVYHTYKNGDIAQGDLQYHFSLSRTCGDNECDCIWGDSGECLMVFDVRELSTWKGDGEPREATRIRQAVLDAISSGILTHQGLARSKA